MAGYRVSRDAENDLIGIWQRIATDNERAAEAFYAQMHQKFFLLATSPLVGVSALNISDNIRKFPAGQNLIYYRIARNRIVITRVLHGKRLQREAFFR